MRRRPIPGPVAAFAFGPLIESAQAMDANTVKQGSARMKIIRADQRLAEARGVKALIVGPTGVGKTSLLRTLDPARVAFRRHRGWRSRRAGSTRSIPCGSTTGRRRATWPAGSAVQTSRFPRPHATPRRILQAVGGAFEHLDQYSTIFVDSITAISRLSFPIRRAAAGGVHSARR